MTVCGCGSRVCTVMQYMSHNGVDRWWLLFEDGVMTVCCGCGSGVCNEVM